MKHFIKPLMFMLLVTVMALAVTSCQAETADNTVSVEQVELVADAKATLSAVADVSSLNTDMLEEEQQIIGIKGSSIVTNDVTENPIMVSHQCELLVTKKLPDDIVDYFQDWIGDNFSSENSITDALGKGDLTSMGANKPNKMVNVYFDEGIQLKLFLIVVDDVVRLKVTYLEDADESTMKLGNRIIIKFANDYHNWCQLE